MILLGELTEKVRALLMSLQITSASPAHTNTVFQLDPGIDLDDALGTADTPQMKKQLKRYKEGNVEKLNKMTSENFGKIQSFASSPALTISVINSLYFIFKINSIWLI